MNRVADSVLYRHRARLVFEALNSGKHLDYQRIVILDAALLEILDRLSRNWKQAGSDGLEQGPITLVQGQNGDAFR